MAGLINYQDPYSALSGGFSQGLANMAQILQMGYARRQQEVQQLREQRQIKQQKYVNKLKQLDTIISFGKSIEDDAKRIEYYKKTLTPELYHDLPDLKPLVEGFKNLSFEEQKATSPLLKQLAKATAENDTETLRTILPQIEAMGIREKHKELVKESYQILEEERKGLFDLYKQQVGIAAQGWKPKTKEEYMEARRAGAPSMTQIVRGEQWETKKMVGAGERKAALKSKPNDRGLFDQHAETFNRITDTNEIAIWDDTPTGVFKKPRGTIIMRLPPAAIKKGWTPKKIQEEANANSMSVAEFLE